MRYPLVLRVAAGDLAQAKVHAEELRRQAGEAEKSAKDAFRQAVAPYRDACRRAGVACEFSGRRAANVSERVSFLVEKTEEGVRVMVKGRPETEEVIPIDVLVKRNVTPG